MNSSKYDFCVFFKKNRRLSLIYILLVLPFIGYGQLTPKQVQQIDSVQQVIKTATNDSTIVKSLTYWGRSVINVDDELFLKLNKKIDSLCTLHLKKSIDEKSKAFFNQYLAEKHNNTGRHYFFKSDYDLSLKSFLKGLKIYKEIDNSKGEIICLNNIGLIYLNQDNYKKAIEYLTQSLKKSKTKGYKENTSKTLNNIGLIYYNLKNLPLAIEFFDKSTKVKKEIGDKRGLSNTFNNIGLIYSEQGENKKALEYYNKSLKIKEAINDNRGAAGNLSNIGWIYISTDDYDRALDYFLKSLTIYEELKEKKGLANSYYSIGTVYMHQKDYDKTIEYSIRSLDIAQEIGAPQNIEDASQALWEAYKAKGEFASALKMYELFVATRDSINSEENQKAVIRQEYKYQYEKQAAADSIKNAEARKVKDAQLTAEKVKNKQQKQQQYFLFVGLAIALLFGGFIFNRFRITNKQKGIIEEQKEEVDTAYGQLEEKNREVLDSITYAKRIQSAMLPKSKSMTALLPESFVLYKPKDIVAGDFYWLEQKEGKILFAAADCTGHGVPGAMVSVVCNNALNKSVNEHKLTVPGEILDTTREIIIHEFKKSEEEVKDGMDIALCTLEGDTLQYAGAYNPLWIIRNGIVLETKADKQPIGQFEHPKAFTTHTIPLKKGDTIYIFSDGYVDQFGGKKGKKLKAKAFKKILLSIQGLSMKEQKEHLDKAFKEWRGNLEQIDDVCIFGVRVN